MNIASSCSPPPRVVLRGKLLWARESLPLPLLVDSGADDSFIDESLAMQAGLPTVALWEPKSVQDLNGRLLARATHKTEPLTLLISGNHCERIQLYLIPSAASPAILGSPWLATHNRQINWVSGTITAWSVACHSCCLHSALPPVLQPPTLPLPAADITGVPRVYHDLGEAFSKQRALTFLPHRPYDCTIDLRPGAPLPSSCLYNLSRPKREAMERSIR